MNNSLLQQVLATENDQLKKLNEIVLRSLEEEKLLTRKLFEHNEERQTFSHRLADQLASFGGSWKFIIIFSSLMVGWIIINSTLMNQAFDPFPFILLNLFLSSLAALQAPVIMMSQNRKEERDRKQAENDYLVNLKSEIEIRNLHQKVDLLMAEQIQTLFRIQEQQIELMDDIRSRLPSR
jgi:uncharacterized membrane protein